MYTVLLTNRREWRSKTDTLHGARANIPAKKGLILLDGEANIHCRQWIQANALFLAAIKPSDDEIGMELVRHSVLLIKDLALDPCTLFYGLGFGLHG